jgi:predicted Zn-dependent protease
MNTLKYYPDHKSALTNLGTGFFEEKKYDSAYFYFKRAYDVDTAISKSSQNLAIYYFTIGNHGQAIQFALNAIKLNKYQLISYEILARAYKATGNDAEAIRYQRLYAEMSAESKEMNIEGD